MLQIVFPGKTMPEIAFFKGTVLEKVSLQKDRFCPWQSWVI